MFKKDFTLRYSTHSKAFFETIDEEYPISVVYEDNAACLHFAKMPKLSPRTKQIRLPYLCFSLWDGECTETWSFLSISILDIFDI